MIPGASEALIIAVSFLLNKAIPGWFKHRVAAKQAQVEQANDLCKNHGDCEAQKIQALQGMKPVVRLEFKGAGPPSFEAKKGDPHD